MTDSDKILIDLGSVKINLFIQPGCSVSVCPTEAHAEAPIHEQTPPRVRSSFTLGIAGISRTSLEKYRARNERIKITSVGMLNLANDVSPELALQVVDSVRVLGHIEARSDVKDALLQAGRIS